MRHHERRLPTTAATHLPGYDLRIKPGSHSTEMLHASIGMTHPRQRYSCACCHHEERRATIVERAVRLLTPHLIQLSAVTVLARMEIYTLE